MKKIENFKKKSPAFQTMLKQYAKEVLLYTEATGNVMTDERISSKCKRFKELLDINDIAINENLQEVAKWIIAN